MRKSLQKPRNARRTAVVTKAPSNSQKAKLEIRTPVRDLRVASAKEIKEKGPHTVLIGLSARYNDYEKRSHQFRRTLIASIYQVALAAKADPDVLVELCDSPRLKDAPRRPNPKKPEKALFYAFMAVFGTDEAGRKKASKEARLLQELFAANRPVEVVQRQLVSPQRPTKKQPIKSDRRPIRAVVEEAEVENEAYVEPEIEEEDFIDLGEIDGVRGHVKTWNGGSTGRVDFTVAHGNALQLLMVFRPMERGRTAGRDATVEEVTNFLSERYGRTEMVETINDVADQND